MSAARGVSVHLGTVAVRAPARAEAFAIHGNSQMLAPSTFNTLPSSLREEIADPAHDLGLFALLELTIEGQTQQPRTQVVGARKIYRIAPGQLASHR